MSLRRSNLYYGSVRPSISWDTSSKPSKLAISVGIAIALAVIGVFVWLWGAQFGHFIWSLVRISPIVTVLFLATIAGVVVVFTTNKQGIFRTAVITSIACFVGSIVMMTFSGYLNAKSYYNASVEVNEVSDSTDLDFRKRPAYDVATAVSNRTLGDTTGDVSGKVKAIPRLGDKGLYSTSVVRRGINKGYESIQVMDLPLYGSTSNKNVSFCDYSENAKLRFGGALPGNSLTRAIYWKTSPSVKASKADAVAVCEDDGPKLYVPLTKRTGFFVSKRVPAGVAIYDGKTGELSIEDEYKGELPLYPSSVAEAQRESAQASGSFPDYLMKRAGFEDTSKDEEDPNGENRAEFGLSSRDGKNSYLVTPLTSRGSTSSLIALGLVDSDHLKNGELNEYTVNRFPKGESRQANSSTAAKIMGEELGGYKAQGLTVFEIVPEENGDWTASIGKNQSILYRANITPEGDVTLYDSNGDKLSGNDDKDDDSPDMKTDKPLDQMSNKELKELGDKILDELADRADNDE